MTKIIIDGEEVEIDDSITRLVQALNLIPGLTTRGSCGGHRDAQPCQVDQDEFYVLFEVARDAAGWRSLDTVHVAMTDDMKELIGFDDWDGPILYGASFEIDQGDYGLRFMLIGLTEQPEARDVIAERIEHIVNAKCGSPNQMWTHQCQLGWFHEGPHDWEQEDA